jgi:hypothetical protein
MNALGDFLVEKTLTYTDLIVYGRYVELYAPVHFRLAPNYDKLGNREQALFHYKYFYSIYKNCDEFWQHNVEHARGAHQGIRAGGV